MWMENLDNMDFYNIFGDGDFGYFVEVDLKYPETLHDAHKDLPFCAEHMAPPGSKQHKLMTRQSTSGLTIQTESLAKKVY